MLSHVCVDSYVKFVIQDSPAAEASMLPGDYLVEINGTDVTEFDDAELFSLISSAGNNLRMLVECAALKIMKAQTPVVKVVAGVFCVYERCVCMCV